jgi:hypothetical protein
MLGSSWVAAQLTASQEGPSSMNEWVSEYFSFIGTYFLQTWSTRKVSVAFTFLTHCMEKHTPALVRVNIYKVTRVLIECCRKKNKINLRIMHNFIFSFLETLKTFFRNKNAVIIEQISFYKLTFKMNGQRTGENYIAINFVTWTLKLILSR